MPDPHQLPYLIKLLDDDSATVRDTVLKQLTLFGPSLEDELARLGIQPTAEQRGAMHPVLEDLGRQWLSQIWPTWFRVQDDKQKLETALSLLAEFQNGRQYPVKLKRLLDQLTIDYIATYKKTSPLELATFLFDLYGLSGASQEEYYDPSNSNLVRVIEDKRGLPISLVCIYVLVGHRLGLHIEGCNFPGHFLAIAASPKKKLIVDCFNRGRVLEKQDLESINATITIDDILRLECHAPVIVARVLRNLITAYQHTNEKMNEVLMGDLLETLERT